MDDSSINPILLSSSAHLENVEQLIKNLEKQTLDIDNFEDILSNRNRHDIITKSFSSVSSSTMAIDDTPEDNFLIKSISLTNTGGARTGFHDENVSMDSLFTQRDLFENDEIKKQQTPPVNDQTVSIDQEGAFSWDDQYDARANYRLTFSTDKQPQMDPKTEKSHRHKHQHRHRKHRIDSRSNSIGSDDGLSPTTSNHMNDWSMRSSFNALEQSIEQRHNKPPPPSASASNHQQTSFIRSQSHPTSFSPQQQIPNNNNNNNHNQSPNSSTTSSSSSASWKRMKDSQRTTSGIEPKEPRPPSPLSLYKIFQQKSQMNASSTSPRSAFQYYRQQADSVVPNNNDSMTISGEKIVTEKLRSSQHQKRQTPIDKSSSQTNSSTDQAIQTSMIFDPSSNSSMNSRVQSTPTNKIKSESYDYLSSQTGSNSPHHLNIPSRQSPAPISSSSIHKSLPDLAFISQYSKELPRSRTTSPLPPSTSSINPTYMASSPTIIQQKQDLEKPRTLKSIKRYKNSKHSTEPLGVFYSPQLRKTFAAVPASAVINGSNEGPKIIKMKLPPPSSYPVGHQSHQTSNLKSCLKYGSRANSCDIQVMLQDRKSPAPVLAIPDPVNNQNSLSPTSKRRCSEADVLSDRPDNLWPSNTHTTGSSNDLNNYVLQDSSRERRSDYDLTSFQQQNQTKKSVSFSENISKYLISPCNPAIKFDPSPEIFTEDNNAPINNDLPYGNQENLSRKVTARYGEMRRCQTDVIVVDRVHHLHSFSESPPNEFRLQETDSFAPEQEEEDDQTIMEKMHVNIIDEPTQTLPTTEETKPIIEKMTSSNDKENKIPAPSINMSVSTITLNPTNDPSLDGVLERMSGIVKRIFDIKRSEKAFFLTNENNTQFDSLLKNDLCPALQNVLEHGLKTRKDLPLAKQITLWKIIEICIDHGQTLQVFNEAKQAAQNASVYWVYKFQAFIYHLLNKNELINWLYYYMKQKDILQRYYQSPDALILVVTPSTFTLFDRFMTQLEKLSPLAFRLVYKPEAIPSNIEEELNTSTSSMHTNKSSARDWVMTISRRTSKTLTQPIVHSTVNTAAANTQQTDTIRSTLSRKINSLFTKTNPTPVQRKTASAVTAKLPTPKPQTGRLASPAPASNSRSRTPNAFANTTTTTTTTTTTKPVIVSSPKSNHANRTGVIRRGISPSVVVAPSPPPTLNTTGTSPSSSAASTFQSKIPRPSLNVDKPKSVRYRSTAPPTK